MRPVLVAIALLALASVPGTPTTRAGEAEMGILPIGIAYYVQTCDEANDPVLGNSPYPSGVTVVIPLCDSHPDSVAWLDWTPPTGGTAELIGAVDSPIAALPIPSWQYVSASGGHTSGNLEFSLNEQAGVPLRVVVTDATCSEMPDGEGAPPCVTGSGAGVSSWTRGVALRPFTLESAHLTGDLSACHGGEAFHGCLIGTFGAYEPAIPFDDIISTKFFGDIVWAFENGITTGCSSAPPLYCPNERVTRGQMATVLDRALDPPYTDVDFFTDDKGTTHHRAINRIAAAGITTGCKPTLYCPKDPVTRGQMATFLDRALELQATDEDFFSDDEGSRHEGAINRVAAAGITSGCGTDRYCPTAAVKRGQMAAFLHRALGD